MIDFITGEKFVGMGNMIFVPSDKRDDDYLGLKNTFSVAAVKENNPCIIYTHTFYVEHLFDTIKDIDHKFIIITHNCDWNIDESFILPDNVIKWYAQNVKTINDKICAIPIGLQNSSWNRYGDKYTAIENKIKEPKRYRNLAYMNFSIATNPPARIICYDYFKDKPWVTVSSHTQNFDRFDDYIDNIYNHKFMLCPEGNGIDTHRFWESLYLNSIPIVLRSALSDALYSYFPVTIVDDWKDVTEELLNKEYECIEYIKAGYDNDKEMLTFKYWENKIWHK